MTRNQYKTVSERRLATIQILKKRLAAEQRLNNALSQLAFLPLERQNPAIIQAVKRATDLKRQAYKKQTTSKV